MPTRIRHTLKRNIKNQGYADDGSFYSYSEAFLYFVDIAKDLSDTFSLYKRKAVLYRDATQLFYGIKNIVLGILSIFFAVVGPLYQFVNHTLPTIFHPFTFFPRLAHDFYVLGGNLLGVVGQVLRGAFQVIACLPFLLRMTWRSFFSRNQAEQTFQERKSVQALVAEADELLEKRGSIGQMRHIIEELVYKAKSNKEKQQKSSTGPVPTTYPCGIAGIEISAQRFINYEVDSNAPISAANMQHGLFGKYLDHFRTPEKLLKKISEKYIVSDGKVPDLDLTLLRAAAEGNAEDVKFLLQMGADPTKTTARDETAYDLAVKYNCTEVIEILRAHQRAIECMQRFHAR